MFVPTLMKDLNHFIATVTDYLNGGSISFRDSVVYLMLQPIHQQSVSRDSISHNFLETEDNSPFHPFYDKFDQSLFPLYAFLVENVISVLDPGAILEKSFTQCVCEYACERESLVRELACVPGIMVSRCV